MEKWNSSYGIFHLWYPNWLSVHHFVRGLGFSHQAAFQEGKNSPSPVVPCCIMIPSFKKGTPRNQQLNKEKARFEQYYRDIPATHGACWCSMLITHRFLIFWGLEKIAAGACLVEGRSAMKPVPRLLRRKPYLRRWSSVGDVSNGIPNGVFFFSRSFLHALIYFDLFWFVQGHFFTYIIYIYT